MGGGTSACCNGAVVTDDVVARHEQRDREDRQPRSPGPQDLPRTDDVPAVVALSRDLNGQTTCIEEPWVTQRDRPLPASASSDEPAIRGDGSATAVAAAIASAMDETDASRKANLPAGALVKSEGDEEGDTLSPLPGFGSGPLPEVEVPESAPPKKNADRPKNQMLRRNLTTQAAGHGGDNILKDWSSTDAIPKYIIKAYDETEAVNYAELHRTEDPLTRFIPYYDGEVEENEDQPVDSKTGKPLRYMRLSNLLLQFQRNPHVMDCKLGSRSFSEAEVSNKKLRTDLFTKMQDMAPKELTPEENEAKAITKHRWMEFNDNFTSLASLGFRIDGICCTRPNGERAEVTKKELKTVRTNHDCAKCIVASFLPTPKVAEDHKIRADVAEIIHGQLQDLRDAMKESDFLATHSLVGASLLFVADHKGPKGDVFLIDFAKTHKVPEGVKIDHKSLWKVGNHEDGALIGMDNMIAVWAEVLALVKPQKKGMWPVRLWKS